jgi:hypothetical protein
MTAERNRRTVAERKVETGCVKVAMMWTRAGEASVAVTVWGLVGGSARSMESRSEPATLRRGHTQEIVLLHSGRCTTVHEQESSRVMVLVWAIGEGVALPNGSDEVCLACASALECWHRWKGV